jgi:hypothetical protein
MTAPDFATLASWIEAGQLDRVTAALLAADEPARRALAGQVRSLSLTPPPYPTLEARPGEDPMRAYGRHQTMWHRHNALILRRSDALLVAGAACLPRASDIVSWLRSVDLWEPPTARGVAAVVRVLRAPGRPSIEAVARSMAEKLRPAQLNRQWPLVGRLLTETGLTPPATEAVVRGWMGEIGFEAESRTIADRLRADPRTALLLPLVFSIPRVAGDLGDDWPPALAGLCASGDYDRRTLLDGCLLRLRAGDRPGSIKPVVGLHRLLDPTIEEYAEHRQEYLGMLAGPHLAVTELALNGLRAVDDAGRLDVDTVVEAAYAVLPRPEKKLVRAQLDWLAAALGRSPDVRLLQAAAAGLHNESVDLAERALTLIARHLSAFGPAGRELLAEAAADLRGDLRRQADALLTPAAPLTPADQPAAPTAVDPVDLPAALPAEPMPAPIASLGELAASVATLLYKVEEPVMLEQVLAGLAAFARSDRPGLARALAPVVPKHWDSPLVWLLRAAMGGTWRAWRPERWEEKRAAPFWMLVERTNELGRQMRGDPPPALLATPATTDGHVAPDRVVALLRAGETDGWQPGPYDLSQALLRLPREVDPAVRRAAEPLVSPAGRAFAGWLADGGLPDPVVVTLPAGRQPRRRDPIGRRRTVAFPALPLGPLTVPPGLLDLPADGAHERAYGLHRDAEMACWPMMFPSHREVIAAHAQPLLAPAADGTLASELDLLPVLARSTGPFGPAMALCLAYGLAAGRASGRLATADAFVRLAADGHLDGTLVGTELAALYTSGVIVLKRVVDGLATVSRAGATEQVWAVARELIPAVLDSSPPAPGAPDLLSLAETAATATGARGDLPSVTATAARGGRTRLVTEAARLARTLTP